MDAPEQLRQAIVRAALPLIGHDPPPSTARLAAAAGVTETDLLAVFPDAGAVVRACAATVLAQISTTLDPAAEIRRLDAIRTDQPLAARLTEALDIVGDYHRRIRADLPAGQPAGHPDLRQALTRLLAPHEAHLHLRLPAGDLAGALLGLACAGDELPSAQVVDLFLHGALVSG
ncbi:hypothetical protein AB0F81_38415 [Actinoplanes sp. NPDC024001]|uniref:hypothetical protein n=1 Tax=Actinoplanes sp. NPDC024001 TaxID=3154598 RepID=UPI0033CB1520